MTRDQFNRAAAEDFCVFSVHLKARAFGQKDPRDQACTFHAAVEEWIATQDQQIQRGLISNNVKDSSVTIVGTGRTMALIDEAFAKDIRYVTVHDYVPSAPPPKPAAVKFARMR